MSQSNQPIAQPTPLSYHAVTPGDIPITTGAFKAIATTAIWARIASLVYMIISAFVIVLSISMYQLTSAYASSRTTAILGVIYYAALAIIMMIPGLYLWRYAGQCKKFATIKDPYMLEKALRAQKAYFVFIAISGAIISLLMCIGIIGMLYAVFMTSHRLPP